MTDNHEDRPGTARRGFLIIDTKKCQGCATCMIACSLVHEGEVNLAKSRIRVVQDSFAPYPDDITSAAVQACDYCADATYWSETDGAMACVAVCPLGAVRFAEALPPRDAAGRYLVNFRGKCWEKIGYPRD